MTSSLKAIALGAILAVSAALSAGAATIFTDRASFDAATGPLNIETFDTVIARAPMITFAGGITSSRSDTTNSPNEVFIDGDDGIFFGFVGRIQSKLITLDFGTGITAFGADFNSLGSLQTDLLEADGSLIESITIAPAGSGSRPAGFFGFISDSPFTQLTFRLGEDEFGGQIFILDDLATGDVAVAPVPLPATLPLLLSAFGGIGFMGRRKSA